LVKPARYCVPSAETGGALTVRVVVMAPGRSAHAPPGLSDCHCTSGAGSPLACAVMLASLTQVRAL